MYTKMANTYIPNQAVEAITLDPDKGNGKVIIRLLSGHSFEKRVTHTTFTELQELLESHVDYDLNGVGLNEADKDSS